MSNDVISFRVLSKVGEAGNAVVSIGEHCFGLLADVFLAGFALDLVG